MKKLLFLFLVLVVRQAALAQNYTWNGSASSAWTNPNNWTPNAVPSATDAAVIPNTTTRPIISTNVSVTQVQIQTGGQLTVSSGGVLNISQFTATGLSVENAATLTNNGTINFNSTATNIYAMAVNGGGTVTNTGTINVTSAFGIANQPGGTFNNNSCGKIFFTSENNNDFRNEGTFNNNGLLQVYWWLHNGGTITNNGVLKYETLENTGTLTNNRILLDDNESPFFTFGANNDATVDGIFTNSTATTSAGTFTQASNTFSPAPSLPAGSQTLYAKIILSGGICTFIVPFLYTNNIPVPVITAQPNSITTCAGASATFSITATGATSYQWQMSTNEGINWNNLTNTSPYSNVTTSTLSISDATGLNNRRYRCVATNSGGSTESNSATLTLSSPTPTPTGAITWQGSVSTDWNTACNWSPASVPGAGNTVIIAAASNQPVVTGNTTVSQITLQENTSLAVNSGATLNIRGSNADGIIFNSGSTFTNNGTTTVQPSSGSIYVAFYAVENATNVTINNNGTIQAHTDEAGFSTYRSSMTITNALNANITFSGDGSGFQSVTSTDNINLTNNGTITYNGTDGVFYGLRSTITNNGLINCTSGTGINLFPGTTFTNAACAQFIIATGYFYIDSPVTVQNYGYIYVGGAIASATPNFFNYNVLKYGSLVQNSTINNVQTSSIVVNNSVPIFSYSGNPANYTGAIAIYSDAAASISAGTFSKPNSFSPLSTLPAGPQTLYAKITPSGSACSYIVPFTYVLIPAVRVTSSLGSITEDGGTNLRYTFTLSSAATTSPLTINFSVGGTATPKYTGDAVTSSTDYQIIGASTFTSSGGSVIIPSGSTSAYVEVDPYVDLLVESNETVSLTITSGTNYTIGTPSSATSTITNDDFPDMNIKGNNTSIADGSTTPSLTNFTDFGEQMVTTGMIERTFTIENTGSPYLLLTGNPLVAISGSHASDFTVTTLPANSIFNVTTFVVRFVPSATGLRTATISIANNDPNENPYDFAIQGTGIIPAPEINVKGNNVNIASGDNSPVITDHSDFGPASVTGSTVTRTFTIENTGTSDLVLGANPVSLTNLTDFSITQPSLTTIPAGSSTTFTVTFDPTTAGLRAATISIANNDSNESPYTFAIEGYGGRPFISTWKTNNQGTSNSTSITLPVYGTYDVDWNNDGIYDQFNLTDAQTHNFGTAGTYTVAIRGNLTSIIFANGGDKSKILSVDQWGDIAWGGLRRAFQGCSNFNITATDAPNLSNATDMSEAFQGATSFNANINHWDISTITTLFATFSGATNFNQPLASWSVSNVTDFTEMFSYASNFNQPLNGWVLSTASNKNITMSKMFYDADAFNQDLNSWNVQRVTNMSFMFCLNNAFNGNISDWDVSNVTTMDNMFYNTTSFNQDLSRWIVSSVTNMFGMFVGSSSFNQNISGWDVHNVTSMGWMFRSATTFNQNLSSWNITKATDMADIFYNSGISMANYDAMLIAWDAAGYTNKNLGNASPLQYCAGQAARNSLTSSKGWSISGDVLSTACLSPKINLKGNNANISSGTNPPSTTNGTDFGNKALGTGAVSKTFIIENLGTGSLTLSGLPIINVTGTNAAEFQVTALPTTTVAAGSSTTFTIGFTPGAVGLRTATVSIANDDSDENPYTFNIQGTGECNITLTAGTVTNPTTCGGNNGSIAFTTTNLPAGSGYTLNYKKGTTSLTASISIAANTFTLNGLTQGSYSDFSITNAGCTGSDATVKTLSDPLAPTITAGTVTNPTTCGGNNGSIAFTTSNLPAGSGYTLNYKKGTTSLTASISITANTFTLSGLTQGSYSEFSITNAGCTGSDATVKILNDPLTPTITAGTVTNPTTCGGNDGSIAFTTTNLPAGSGYTLNYKKGTTSLTASISIAANAFALSGLTQGSYSEFSITNAGCTGSDATAKTLSDPLAPTITAGTVTNPTTCGGNDGSIAFTTSNLPAGSGYTLNYKKGTTSLSAPISIAANTFTLSGLTQGSYSEFSITNAGCTGSDATVKTLSDPLAPTITAGTVTNPSTCGGNDGSIAFTTTNLPAGSGYTLNYKKGATSLTASISIAANTFTLSGLTQGSYSEFSITNAGCTGSDATVKTLSDPLAPTITAGTVTNPSTCGGNDGSIAFTTSNLPAGSGYTLNYKKGTTSLTTSISIAANTFTLSGLTQGSYSEFSITNAGCTGSDATVKTLSDPSAPTFAAGTVTNPTTCGGNNGSIAFSTTNLSSGNYILNYKKGSNSLTANIEITANAFTLSGLIQGSYSEFSITNAGCTGSDATVKTLSDPLAPTITAGTVTNPTTCGGNDGSIAFTTSNLPAGSGYTLNYKKGTTSLSAPISIAANTFTLSGLTQGSYSEFSITNAGCTGSDATVKTLSDPLAPTITAGTVTNPSTCGGNDGSIAFTTTNLPAGSGYTLNYKKGATSLTASISIAANTFTLSGLTQGSYSEFSITNAGCTGSDATVKTLSDPLAPTITAGTVTNPSTCGGNDGSIAFTTSNLPAGSGYTLNYKKGTTSLTTSISIAANTFTLSGLTQGSYSEFSITNAGCTGSDATVKTLSDPSAPTFAAGTATNPSTCGGNDGSIAFNTSNLPTGSGYTLNYKKGTTSLSAPISIAANAFTLSGLTQGSYSEFSITNAGCTGSDATVKSLSDPLAPTITAGTVTNPTTCGGNNGSIAFTTSNLPAGSGYTLNYKKGTTSLSASISITANTFTLSELAQGSYSEFSITNAGCTGSDATVKTLNDPSAPTIAAGTATNPSTCGGNNGSIAFTTTNLSNGNYTLNYKKGSTSLTANIEITANAFTLGGLTQGSYSEFSITNAGCTGSDATVKSLSDPLAPTITAGTTTNPSTCGGNNGSIAFTSSNLANGNYTLNYKKGTTSLTASIEITANGFTLSGLTQSSYSEFSITNAGCTGSDATVKTLSDPAAPTIAAGTATNPTSCGGSNGSIAFTTTNLANGNYTLNYKKGTTSLTATVEITANTFTLSGLTQGSYSDFSITNAGCTGSDATVKNITASTAPTAFLVTGGGAYCDGGIGVGLSGSEIGVNYQLKVNGTNTGSPVAGTGSELNFGNQLLTGTYTVEATHNSGNCSGAMNGSVTVNRLTKPSISLSLLQTNLNEGNSQVFCDTDANPVNSLQFTVLSSCVSGSLVWRVQVGNGAWSAWSTSQPVSQLSNNQPHRYQAACDASCPSTYTTPIELTINNRASVPQNVSLLVDGVTVAVGETKEVCSLTNSPITFNANCTAGEAVLYAVDGGEYTSAVPTGLVDNQYHNYRVRCRKSDGTPSCVESESGVMRLKLINIPSAPTVSLSSTTSCDATASFSGQSSCGSLRTVWYNASSNVALPSLPATVPPQTTSYYARCQTENGCVSEKSNVVTFTVIPTHIAPIITASEDIVCMGSTVRISANCPAGSQTFWNTGVTTPSFEVAFNNVTKQSYWAKCIFEGGCQSAESSHKDIYWNAFAVTIINIGQSQSAIKPTNNKLAWASQFVTPDGGPVLLESSQSNPTLYFVENFNKTAPRYWTVNVDACGLGTNGSLTFDMLATPEMGVIRSFNTHENNAPYFMYANREGWTELYAQNHPAYGFYQDNGAGGNTYDAGLPKGLYKLSIRYWDMKGWGSIYPSTRQPQGNVLAYQEYWFRIQSKDGVGVGAARTAESVQQGSDRRTASSKEQKQMTIVPPLGARGLAILPNPVTDILRLQVQDSKGLQMQAELMDASGRRVLRRQFVPETNTHQEEFEASGLPNGIYFLKVANSTNTTTLKVIKVQ
ncbi:MAG: BspA family leucine-rich repeat surface protein [Bacteroidetes bacterium]|nr:BspA family leucine-rich repeat surface protein [Bacteroidota bacterium]